MAELPVTTICDLPDEILHHIFSYLSERDILAQVVDVCTRWRCVIEMNLSFWNNLQVVIDCDWFLDWGFFGNPLKNISQFSPLRESDRRIYVGEKDLVKVSKLRCIKLVGGSRSGGHPLQIILWVFEKVRKVCKDIKKVEFFDCFGATSKGFINFLNDNYDISELKFGLTSVWRIPYEEFPNFRNLTTLITNDYKFNRTALTLLANGCDKLENLWILCARSIKNDNIIYFLEKKKEIIKELGVGFSITDISVAKVKECQKLKVLFISDARNITAEGLKHLTNLPSLKYMSLHRSKISPEFMKEWVRSSTIPKHLAILDLSAYTLLSSHQDIFEITKICPVTFNNDVHEALTKSYNPEKSRIHWMYRNNFTLIFKEHPTRPEAIFKLRGF